MPIPTDFFAEFPPVRKAEWLAQIAKDLKGRPLEELNWLIAGDIVVEPFGHADDFENQPEPLARPATSWEICEDIDLADPAAANRLALDALAYGAEALRFHFERTPGADALALLLEGIHPDYIGLHFAGPGVAQNPGAVLALLQNLAQKHGIDPASLRGSLAYDLVAQAGLQDWRYLADLLAFAKTNFPQFRVITAADAAAANAPEGLAALLRKGNLYLEKLSERGIPPAEVAAQLQFSFAAGKSYFLEIARLRAFKMLWINVLNAWGVAPAYPVLEVHFQPEAYTDELYANMIRATTMAMSAVLGGADRLTVAPYDAGRESQAKYPQAFARRIARNVQHLLKMESALDATPDPAAGSYYIEKLSAQLTSAAWEQFRLLHPV